MKKVSLWGSARWFVVAVLLLSSLMAFARMAGDIDNDDQLTSKDVLLLQKFLMGTATPTSEEDKVADVAPLNSPDGQLTASDLLVLQQGLLGSITLPLFPDSPTLDSIPSSTTTSPLPITGVAGANNEVRLYVNGELQSTTTSAGDGSFTINAILADGTNDIYVTQWDGVYESLNAASQIVEYQNTVNPITAALVASRLSGPAPLAVHFDATGTTHTNSDVDPWRQVGYYFDYDDPTSGTWAISGQSKNIDFGAPLGGHVFETPGEYLVGVRALLGEDFDDAWVTITVTDPDVVYAGTNTVCLSTGTDMTGCPAGATQLTNVSGWPAWASNRRYLLREGDDFSALGQITLYEISNWQLRTYGSGARPIVAGIVINHDEDNVATPPENGLVQGLALTAQLEQRLAFKDLLIYDVDLSGFGSVIRLSSAFGYYAVNQRGTSQPQDWKIPGPFFIVDSHIDSDNDPGPGKNNISGVVHHLVVLGTLSEDVGEHTLRLFGGYKSLIGHSIMTGPTTQDIRTDAKLMAQGLADWAADHSFFVGNTTTEVKPATEYIVLRNNTFGHAGSPHSWHVQVAPQDTGQSGTVEGLRNIIVENNTWIDGSMDNGLEKAVQAMGRNITERGGTIPEVWTNPYSTTSYPSAYTNYGNPDSDLYTEYWHGPYYMNDTVPTVEAPERN